MRDINSIVRVGRKPCPQTGTTHHRAQFKFQTKVVQPKGCIVWLWSMRWVFGPTRDWLVWSGWLSSSISQHIDTCRNNTICTDTKQMQDRKMNKYFFFVLFELVYHKISKNMTKIYKITVRNQIWTKSIIGIPTVKT